MVGVGAHGLIISYTTLEIVDVCTISIICSPEQIVCAYVEMVRNRNQRINGGTYLPSFVSPYGPIIKTAQLGEDQSADTLSFPQRSQPHTKFIHQVFSLGSLLFVAHDIPYPFRFF